MIIRGNKTEPHTMSYSSNNKKFYYKDFVYLPILKNAHRLSSTILEAYGFKLDPNVNITDRKILVVLSDPISRWYKGMSQFLYLHCPNLEINNELLNFLTRIVVVDGHTRAQVNFLAGVNTDNCIFFDMENNFETSLRTFCTKTFGGKMELNRQQPYSTNSDKYKNIKQLLEHHCTTEYLKRLETYYKDDIELYNSTNFYRG